jgi:protein-L-isoaspartate(D-aspartate) O-methyltransferase
MVDYVSARTRMVDNQLRTNDVTDYSVLDAIQAVPREMFVPSTRRALAYIDEDVPLGDNGRALMKPHVFGKLIQAAGLLPADVVLIVGAGTGYSAAVVARIASAVFALEQDTRLADQARATLSTLGADTVSVVTGPLTSGWAADAPYDAIIVEGAVEFVPTALFDQLRDGGRLVAIEGHGRAGRARLYTRSGSDVSGRLVFNCAARPLPGFARPKEFVF